jgi:hypothetical protein
MTKGERKNAMRIAATDPAQFDTTFCVNFLLIAT